MKKLITSAAFVAITALALTGCSGEPTEDEQAVTNKAEGFKAYIPENDVELENYNKAQELYDDPAAIQWCTAFPSSNSAPIITLPIGGKLTTSATSFFSPTKIHSSSNGKVNEPNRSVDGLFHGDSFYRYGFTPAGQYTEFSNSLELLCTTNLTEFQRQNTFVEGVDTKGDVDAKQEAAEAALKDGDGDKAAKILGGK